MEIFNKTSIYLLPFSVWKPVNGTSDYSFVDTDAMSLNSASR